MHYYDVFPKVVPADREGEIHVVPRFEHAAFPPADQLKVRCLPYDGYRSDHTWRNISQENDELKEWHLNDKGELVVRAFFTSEQEHSLSIDFLEAGNPERVLKNLQLQVYSLGEDLFGLRPFKGDFHIHTTRSDGRECPPYVAARYRQEGFDFAAISDHHKYEPSLEAIRFWEKLKLDFKLFPGEEVHSPGNDVHIINFGADASINRMCRDDEPKYRKEVLEILETIQDRPMKGLDYYQVAASEWVFRRIREHHGLAVYCHPYWYCSHQNVLNEALLSEIFRRRGFDALELIGGYGIGEQNSNNFQVVRWAEEQAKGNRFPVVGLSDSHGTTLTENSGSRGAQYFTWYCTVILAKSDQIEDLIEGVKSYHSTAVTQPEGQRCDIYGDFRVVRYVDFLRREYFPIHRELCRTEGSLMLDYLAGEKSVAKPLEELQGRVPAFRESFFRQW